VIDQRLAKSNGRRDGDKPQKVLRGCCPLQPAYEISASGTRTLVPSEVNLIGGGFGSDPEPEWVDFYVNIPLQPDQLDAEVSRYLAKLEGSMTPEQREQYQELNGKKARDNLRVLIREHRTGHFQVECRILDGARVMGVDVVELEVLFKGHFSDIGLPASPPA
jgi:hypothetical protein